MTRKTDERIEEIERWKTQREIEEGVRNGLDRWKKTICMTSVSALVTAIYSSAKFIYFHCNSFAAAIKAYLIAEHGGQ